MTHAQAPASLVPSGFFSAVQLLAKRKNKQRGANVLLCLLALACTPAWATPMTLVDALARTDMVASVQSARLAKESAERLEHAGEQLVTLNLSSGYQFGGAAANGGAWDALRVDAAFNVLPYGPEADAKAARSLETQSAALALLQARSEAHLDIARMYAEAQESKSAASLDGAKVKLETLKAAAAQAQARAGALSDIDLKNTALELSSAKLTALQSQRQYTLKLQALRILVQVPGLELSPNPVTPFPMTPKALAQDVHVHALVSAARLELARAALAAAAARRGLLPIVSSSVGLSDQAGQLGVNFDSDSFQPSAFASYQPGNEGGTGVHASLSLRIPLDASNHALQTNADAQLSAAQHALAQAETQAQQEILNKLSSEFGLFAALRAAKAQLSQAQEVSALQQRRFALGVATPAERLEARVQVQEAALEVLKTQHALYLAQLELRQDLSLPWRVK